MSPAFDSDMKPLATDFDQTDLEALRNEMLQAGLDCWQAGELIASFLAMRGYGVSAGDARSAASRIESASCSLECMRHELDRFALMM